MVICSACALLGVLKLPSAGTLAPRLPDTTVHVIRNKRKKLAITAVDVDPDAELRQQERVKNSDGPSSKPTKATSIDF